MDFRSIFIELSINLLDKSQKKEIKFFFVQNIYTLASDYKTMTSVNYIFYSFYYFFFKKEIEALYM